MTTAPTVTHPHVGPAQDAPDNLRMWRIDWLDVTVYVRAETRGKARAWAMRMARDADAWRPGQSLRGLRCRVSVVAPPDAQVGDANRDKPL